MWSLSEKVQSEELWVKEVVDVGAIDRFAVVHPRTLLFTIGSALLVLTCAAALADTTYVEKRINPVELEFLLSCYSQDGLHSAVTGGTGTEDLQVYASDVRLTIPIDSLRSLSLDVGTDVISSASTDRIDFRLSSPSSLDLRYHLSVGYDQSLTDRVSAGASGSISVESDYLSVGGEVRAEARDHSRSNVYSVALQAFADDLRWGHINPYRRGRPIDLVYPVELRGIKWFDTYRRYSLNVSTSWVHTVNRRMTITMAPGMSYQQGLLSTPFHRVYFEDESQAKPEQLPDTRLRVPVGIGLNAFVGPYCVVRSGYRFYWDDFGITSHTGTLESALKLSPFFTVTPFVRMYTQTAADFFAPYKEHASSEVYYTSDYDLSGFNSVKAGLGMSVRFTSAMFREVALRYAYYRRDDGLFAHILESYTRINF